MLLQMCLSAANVVFRAHILDPVKTPEDERLEHNPHGGVWSFEHMICSFQPLILQECRDWSLFGTNQTGPELILGALPFKETNSE